MLILKSAHAAECYACAVLRAPSMWSVASLTASSGVSPALARDDVGGVPPRPVVLRSGRFVLAMARLCLSQKLGQRRDVQC